jgi:hypothetical protein
MEAERVGAIRARLNLVTDGPWQAVSFGPGEPVTIQADLPGQPPMTGAGHRQPDHCAQSRLEVSDVPLLRMRKAISELRETRETMARYEQRTARVYARIIIGRPIFGSDAS